MKSPAVRTKTIVYRFEFGDTNIRTSGKLVPQIQRRIRFGKCVMAFNQRAKSEIAQLTVQRGNITSVAVDVIAVKHAQNFYGADLAVARCLREKGVSEAKFQPNVGEHALLLSNGASPRPVCCL